jgi:hypothetical protein
MKLNVLIIAVLLFVLILGCHKPSDDENTLSFDEIKNKLESAQEGDTVNIPAGIINISNGVLINKNIIIIGAGVDKTIFTDNITTNYQATIQVNGNNSSSLRISGITFQTAINSSAQSPFIRITGSCKQFRIDHCNFKKCRSNSILITGITYGVIDHCNLCETGNNIQIISEIKDDMGDAVWAANGPIGTDNAVFVEDCSFTGSAENIVCSIDGFCGSRYVFRHNTVHTASNYPLICVHGSYGYGRGGYSAEIYDNNFDGNGVYYGLFIRGGRGVLYNNAITGKVDLPICFAEYRSFVTKEKYLQDFPNTPLHPNWTELDDEKSELTGYCDNHYPAPDQINNFYVWNNKFNGDPVGVSVRDIGVQKEHIQPNRDYFEYAMPGYVPYTYPHPLTQE